MSQTSANPVPNPVIPLNGLLEIQQNYLNDLDRITTGNTSAPLLQIKQKLELLNSNFANANTSANGILTHQDKMKDIIEDEYGRISVAKQEIDNIHLGKMRSIELNDNYRKRNVDYMRIVIAIVVSLIIYVLLSIFVPEPIYSFSIIILFSIFLIYSVNVGWEIYNRENTNYDRLDLKAPITVMKDTVSAPPVSSTTSTSTTSESTPCVGEACCSSGSRWDASMNQCIISCNDANIPISQGNTCIARSACAAPSNKICGNACISSTQTCGPTTTNPFSTLGDERIRTKHDNGVQPYSPFEYSEYSRI